GTVGIRIDKDGVVTISSAMLDQGAGTYTLLCEIVGEELQIPLSRIKTDTLDTETGKPDTGVGASRATRVYGNAGYQAAVKAADALKQAAASRLGVAAEDVVLVDGIAQTKRGGKRVSYGELAKANGGSIAVEATYSDTSKIHEASMCAQVAEVEVDPETRQ